MALRLATLSIAIIFLSGLLPLLFSCAYQKLFSRLNAGLLMLGSLCALVAGCLALLNAAPEYSQTIPLSVLPMLSLQLKLDTLSGYFFFIVGLVGFAVAIYLPAYIQSIPHKKYLCFFTAIFMSSMLLVLLANNVFIFLLAWELMSLSSYFLVAHEHEHETNRQAAFIYLLMAQMSGICILISFGLLAKWSGNLNFNTFTHLHLSPTWTSVIFILGLWGFGTKAGLVPLHAWLPKAHPVAPSPISALMSGVMLKIAVYGFIRLSFYFLTIGNLWPLGGVVLFIGTISALIGVLYAIMQHDVKCLLAYHSVENIGIIFIGLGLSLIFQATNHPLLAALGLLAALYHCLNHALFKSLLFLGAGSVIQQTHEHDLEHMGGLIHKMPRTAFYFLIGCLSISALPPFNGFVSEWLTFQTALQSSLLANGLLRILIPLAAAILALTGILAATCFVKTYGMIFLGKARSISMHTAHEAPRAMRLSMALLASCCLFFGLFPSFTLAHLNTIAEQSIGYALPASGNWLWLTPISVQQTAYSGLGVFIALLFITSLVYFWWHPRKYKLVSPWDCGFGGLTERMQYTGTAFAMPIRRIFQAFWKITETQERRASLHQPYQTQSVHYALHTDDWSWEWFYKPWRIGIKTISQHIAKWQSGHLRLYLTYMFVTLIILLWLVS